MFVGHASGPTASLHSVSCTLHLVLFYLFVSVTPGR